MDLGSAIVYAALKGTTTALPLSDSGHELAARIWLGGDGKLPALMAVAQLGCLLAFVVVVRERLAAAFGEGIRGIARPAKLQSTVGGRDATAIVVAALSAVLSEAVTRHLSSPLNEVPVVVGCGLMLAALALASTLLAPAPHHMCPGLAGAALVGLAYGLAS